MTRTEQAHSWALYLSLLLVLATTCYAFLFTADKLSEGTFAGIVTSVVAFFFSKPVPKPSTNGHANGAATAAAGEPKP